MRLNARWIDYIEAADTIEEDGYEGEGDSENFREDVELEIVSKAFGRSYNGKKVKPDFKYWAPYMNKASMRHK